MKFVEDVKTFQEYGSLEVIVMQPLVPHVVRIHSSSNFFLFCGSAQLVFYSHLDINDFLGPSAYAPCALARDSTQ